MKPVVKTITCPKCWEKQSFIMYQRINASSNLADKSLDGNLTTLTCEECGFSGIVEYPMLYHDLDKKYSVFFAPDKSDREAKLPNFLLTHLLPEMRRQLVHNADELREKIFIFRDLLEDQIVETVKDSILREMDARHEEKMADALYYAQGMFGCEGWSLIFIPRKRGEYLEPIKNPVDTYEKIKMLMLGIWERTVDGYIVVDKLWVQSATKKEQT